MPGRDLPVSTEGLTAVPLSLGRLARGGEIRKVLRTGRNYGCAAGSARIREGAAGEHRLCVVASRQVGKAVVRNRIRRAVREIIRREIVHDAAPVDLVFRARPASSDMGFWAIHGAVTDILRRAGLRARPDPARWG